MLTKLQDKTTSLLNYLARPGVAKPLTLATIIFIFINCLLFTYYNANPLIKSDGWRYINIYLIPWYNNELHWSAFWHDHHPQPLTASLFLINANFFSLRMDYEALFAVCFSLLSVFTIWRSYISMTVTEGRPFNKYIFILIVTALLCSLSSTAVYSWSLVTLGHVFIFAALLTLAAINKSTEIKPNSAKFVIYTLLIVLLFILFSDGAKILIYSCFIILSLVFILERKTKWLIPIVSIILAISLQYAFLSIVNFETQYNEMRAAFSILDKLPNLLDYFLYIGVGLLSAWVNIEVLINKAGANHVFIYSLGIFIFIANISTLFLYFKKRLYTFSIIPGTLILSSILSGVGASLFRFNPDAQSALAANVPRYYLLYVLGAIGIIWTWSIILEKAETNNRRKAITYTVIFSILLSQMFSSAAAWKSTPYRKKAFNISHQIMLENAAGDRTKRPPAFMVGGNYPEPYFTGLETLKEHNLNIFASPDIMKKFKD